MNELAVVSTDHCPFCFKDQKELGLGDFSKIPNGIGGVEHRMELLYQGVVAGELSLERWVETCCTTPARMFGMYPRRGSSRRGPTPTSWSGTRRGRTTIGINAKHHMNMDYSAYEGFVVDGKVDTVLSRGTVVIEDDAYVGRKGHGRFVDAGCRSTWCSGGTGVDIGVVLQTTPPSARVVDLAKRAETYGFSHVWTFDSHMLWQEPFPIYTRILAETRNVIVGPMVTNPLTRDWTVTASLFATLNEMFGNRTVIGIGRGDSAVRVINGKPSTLAALGEAIHVIRELANGREVDYRGSTLRFPWATKSRVEVWMAGYGPKALKLIGEVGDGFILQLADPDIAAWTIGAVRRAAEEAGRDPAEVTICVAAPAFVGDDLAYARDQCRWFGGMVGNHVADIVARYGESSDVPAALTDYIKGREGYDYNEHGQVGNVHTAFVPDDIVDRFCILGPVAEHVRRLQELHALGVDQFAVYLQHDAKDETLQAYGEKVLPAIAEHVTARS